MTKVMIQKKDGPMNGPVINIVMKNTMERIMSTLAVMSAILVSCSKEMLPDGHGQEGVDGYRITLRGSADGAATRITEDVDAYTGLRTSWEEGEAIKVMYSNGGTAAIADLVSAEGDGLFTGEVESGAAAAAFESSELHCVNASTRILTFLEGSSMVSEVDLSGQDGSLSNVAGYELMYVKGTADKLLRFRHLTSVLRMNFTGLSGGTVSSASFSFTPSGVDGGGALFADKATYRFGQEGISSETEDIIFYEMHDISIPVTDGEAVIYLVVPERGQLYGELSVVLKCGNDTFRRYVKLAGKSFKACNVVARKEILTDNDRVPGIGDYVYSDGTWGPLVYYEDKWPQAVIFSNYTSAEDRAAGYTHGYAMALRDAAWPTSWAPESEVAARPDYPETENVFETSSDSAPLLMMENLRGLSTCTVLNELYLKDFAQGNYYGLPGFEPTGGRAAIPCAMRYGKDDWVVAYGNTENIAPFEAPENTSGWFLPSVGQWYLCLANLAGIDPNDLVLTSNGGVVTELAWKFPSSSVRQEYLNTFTAYFSSAAYYNPILAQYVSSGRMVATVFYLPYNGQMDWYLWACDEATSDGTASVVFLNSTDIIFKYVEKQTGEDASNGYAARSILAF